VRHTYGDRAWGFPGGLAKRGEAALDTSKRELSEELALQPADWSYLGEVQMAGEDRARHIISCYTCAAESRSIEPSTAEIEEVGWYHLDRLPGETLQGTAEIAELAQTRLGSR
jgi:ADP-ribose pyrophosphatase YjhB (NUDIX family)